MQLPDSYFLDNTTPKIKMAMCATAHPKIVKKPCIKHPQYLKPYYQRLQTVWRQQEHDVLTRKNTSSNGGDVCEKREFWEGVRQGAGLERRQAGLSQAGLSR
jgi:hypothetical protein